MPFLLQGNVLVGHPKIDVTCTLYKILFCVCEYMWFLSSEHESHACSLYELTSGEWVLTLPLWKMYRGTVPGSPNYSLSRKWNLVMQPRCCGGLES